MSLELDRSGPELMLVAKTHMGQLWLWTEPKDRARRSLLKAGAKAQKKKPQPSAAAVRWDATVEMDYAEFMELVRYVFRNEDLRGPKDPRLQFIKDVKRIKRVEGWNPDRERLEW